MSQPLQLQLIPQQLFKPAPTEITVQDSLSLNLSTGKQLVLVPGEPSEMLVRLENTGTQALEFDLQLVGSFPPDWCQVRSPGQVLQAGDRLEVILLFQLPADFFEQQAALRSGETLQLNYECRLNLAAAYVGNFPQLIESVSFTVFARPRSLYLDFLPEIYREGDFVSRFLKIMEETFEPDVQMMDNLWAYLDPLTAPAALLPFLAHWVGWTMQPHLNQAQQRRLIRYALQIYRWRGTRRGLRLALHLATNLPLDSHLPETEKSISLYETFSQGLLLGTARLGQDAILGGGKPYHFVVCLRPDAAEAIDETLVRTVIEQEKPAFCSYELSIQPRSHPTAESLAMPKIA